MQYFWTVDTKAQGQSLLHFLKNALPDQSNKQIKKALSQGLCKKNGYIERFACIKLVCHDSISFILPTGYENKRSEEIKILYQDDYILIVDKPKGLECTPKILAQFSPDLFLVHRLDKYTSGVFMLAKSKQMQSSLQKLFKEKKIQKKYIAFVDKRMKKKKGVISSYLVKKGYYQGQTIWGSSHENKGLFARTEFTLISANDTYSVVNLFPITGKTHQLRVHLKEMGHPILGDYQYSRRFFCQKTVPSLMLHAEELSFIHPQSQEKITIASQQRLFFQNA